MSKKTVLNPQSDLIRVIIVVLASAFSALILSFSVLAIINLQEDNFQRASLFLLLVFISLGFSKLITVIKKKDRKSLVSFIVFLLLDIALGIIIYFGKDNAYLYSLCGGLFCLSIILSRLLKIIYNHSTRGLILNIIIILLVGLLAVGLFIPVSEDQKYSPIIIICVIAVINALVEVMSGSFNQMNGKVLFKIVIRTYALEVFLGLLTTMVGAAIVFMHYEETIPTFGDGLWYSFAIVTTIGFGDFYAKSLIGRLVSVFLGLYGIIVVAVITSIVVNFYNETAGKIDTKNIKKIKNEEE